MKIKFEVDLDWISNDTDLDSEIKEQVMNEIIEQVTHEALYSMNMNKMKNDVYNASKTQLLDLVREKLRDEDITKFVKTAIREEVKSQVTALANLSKGIGGE